MEQKVKVGDRVRLVGSAWRKEYDEFEDKEVNGEVIVTIDEIDAAGNPWAGWAGSVGNSDGLFSADNPGGSGDYSAELVEEPEPGSHYPRPKTTGSSYGSLSEEPNVTKNDTFSTSAVTEEQIRQVGDIAGALGVTTFDQDVNRVLEDIGRMLITKNRAYGNAALNPVNVFSKSDRMEQIRVRIDDKLNRIRNGYEYPGDDTVNDLIGYLVLYKIAGESE